MAEGDPAAAVEALGDVQDTTQGVHAFTLVETHLLAGIAHLELGDQNAAAAAAEAALAAAEPDRLMFPFAMTGAAELLDALPRHKTAHGALLADTVSLLREEWVPSTDRERLTESDELSPSELRVLRYLPTNLTRARDRERALRVHRTRSPRTSATSTPSSASAIGPPPFAMHASCGSCLPAAPNTRAASAALSAGGEQSPDPGVDGSPDRGT